MIALYLRNLSKRDALTNNTRVRILYFEILLPLTRHGTFRLLVPTQLEELFPEYGLNSDYLLGNLINSNELNFLVSLLCLISKYKDRSYE